MFGAARDVAMRTPTAEIAAAPASRRARRGIARIADPCIPGLLDLGLCLIEETQKAKKRK